MTENEVLRAVRQWAGMTQEEAAAAFGLNRTTWTMREAGLYPIPDGFIGEVRAAFLARIGKRALGINNYSPLLGEEVVSVA